MQQDADFITADFLCMFQKGKRDQKIFTTNLHKTETKVVVGRRGEEQEVKRRQRKTQ